MPEYEAKEEQCLLGHTTIKQILLQNNLFDETNQLDASLNHSGYVANTVIVVDVGVQFNSAVVCPKIHKIREWTDEIKLACANVSVKCNISKQTSHIAVQTVCNIPYGYKYYLKKDEVIQNDPSLEKYKTTGPSPSKQVKSAENSKVPIPFRIMQCMKMSCAVQKFSMIIKRLTVPQVLKTYNISKIIMGKDYTNHDWFCQQESSDSKWSNHSYSIKSYPISYSLHVSPCWSLWLLKYRVLADTEKQLDFRNKSKYILRWSKSVVDGAIALAVSLASHKKSPNSTN